MAVLAKIAAATLGTGGISVAGCYAGGLIKFGESKPTDEKPPIVIPWSPLNKDTNFAATYNTENTIGKDYGQYLTGIEEANKQWWEEAYKKYEADKSGTSSLHEIFSSGKVNAAYNSETNNTTALNKVCETAYKKNSTTDVDFSATGSDDKHKLTANILKYCSPLGKIPVIIANNGGTTYAENTAGKQGNTKKLVSMAGTENDGFWKAQQEWFKGKGSGSLDTYFNQFFSGSESAKTLNDGQTIKKICEETYTKEVTTDATTEKPKIDDVAKYCSFQKLA